jgi:hypothetical protein
MLPRHRWLTLLVSLVLVAVSSLLAASPAPAWDRPADVYQVVAPGEAGTYARTAPDFSSSTIMFLANNTQLDISCRSEGQKGATRTLQGDAWQDATTSTWNQLSNGSWVFDGHTNADPRTTAIPSCATLLALPTAPTCDGVWDASTSCATSDPEVSRCVTSGLVLLASGHIGDPDGGTAQLWYSRTCRAGWMRATWPQVPSYFSDRNDTLVDLEVASDTDFLTWSEARPSNVLWSRMANAKRGECIFGKVTVRTPAGAYTSPELRDCS